MKSRLPQIQRELPAAVNKALKESTGRIAARGAAAAPTRTGELKASLSDPANVRPGVFQVRDRPAQGYGIYAAWYWFFAEFGTKRQPAEPFMVPVAEAERPRLVAEVKKALGNL